MESQGHEHRDQEVHRQSCLDPMDRRSRSDARSAVEFARADRNVPGADMTQMSVRVMRTVDGRLEQMHGNAIKRKQQKVEGADIRTWLRCLDRCGRSKKGMTFREAQYIFQEIRGHWAVTAGLPDMPPPNSVDWDRKVSDVCPKYAKERAFPGAIK